MRYHTFTRKASLYYHALIEPVSFMTLFSLQGISYAKLANLPPIVALCEYMYNPFSQLLLYLNLKHILFYCL